MVMDKNRIDIKKKISQYGTANIYCFALVQDFSHSWTDTDLHAKHGLTPEEIAFIESTINRWSNDNGF